MKPVRAYEGLGRFYTCPFDAAAEIIEKATHFEIKCTTDIPPGDQRLADAIVWLADEIRKRRGRK